MPRRALCLLDFRRHGALWSEGPGVQGVQPDNDFFRSGIGGIIIIIGKGQIIAAALIRPGAS
jgi:hypothetical protein